MAGTSKRSFDLLKKVQGKCKDHAEFDQSAYIKEGLHNSEDGKSCYDEGVCAALAVYSLVDWLKKGTRPDTINQYISDCNDQNSKRPTLDIIEGLSHKFENSKDSGREAAIKEIQALAGKKPKAVDFKIKASEAIETMANMGPCFLAWGGTVKTGHAMICDGSKFAIFDPNYGYYQAKSTDDFFWTFKTIIANYPDYAKTPAVTIFNYA